MDGEDRTEELLAAIRRLADSGRAADAELASLRAQLKTLIEILVGREVLNSGHARILAKTGAATHARAGRVQLRMYVDKYAAQPAEPIDCASLMHLCKGRCCTLRVVLTSQDVEEGVVRWDLQEPYLLRHEADGRCTHQVRSTGMCGVYEQRPETCRSFSCREDRRIWLDFENQIPAPMTAISGLRDG